MLMIDWRDLLFYAFSAAALIQLFYYTWFFSRLAFFKKKERPTQRQQPVSVIICARDEDENLARNLPGVLVQQYPSSKEVVVINDNSVDDSKFILQELKRTFKNLQIVELTQEAKLIAGKKYPLSIGIREANHEILLLTDADCVPSSEHWIQKMQEAYGEETEIVLGYGGYHRRKGLLNKLIRFETFHTALQYLSYALAGIPYMGVGRNLSYRKDLFLRNKGFSSINHIPSGDDDLFINKLGLYFISQFLFYPLLGLALAFSNWQWVVGVAALKLVPQAIVLYKAMVKLDEKDLWPWFIFLDMWMFFYYLLFFPALWRRPAKNWN